MGQSTWKILVVVLAHERTRKDLDLFIVCILPIPLLKNKTLNYVDDYVISQPSFETLYKLCSLLFLSFFPLSFSISPLFALIRCR